MNNDVKEAILDGWDIGYSKNMSQITDKVRKFSDDPDLNDFRNVLEEMEHEKIIVNNGIKTIKGSFGHWWTRIGEYKSKSVTTPKTQAPKKKTPMPKNRAPRKKKVVVEDCGC